MKVMTIHSFQSTLFRSLQKTFLQSQNGIVSLRLRPHVLFLLSPFQGQMGSLSEEKAADTTNNVTTAQEGD